MPIGKIALTMQKAAWKGYAALLVLIASACFCLISMQEIRHDDDSGETFTIRWKPYSEATKNTSLNDGKKVLVFVFAEFSPESPLALESIDSAKAKAFCNAENYEALLLRYSDWGDPNIRAVWADVGHTKNPFVAVYSPKESPIAFDPLSGATLCP